MSHRVAVRYVVALLVMICPSATIVAQKSADIVQEAKAAERANNLLGGGPHRIIGIDIPEMGTARSLVVVEKLHPTPMTYPRRPGVPAKNPL